MTELWIGAELEQNAPDTNDYPIPEAREATEIPDPLYSSERDYTEQLARYKEFQGKA